MKTPRTPTNELVRLNTLKSYQILDSSPEEEFDNLTNLASEICQTPISLITFLDETRQWFKSTTGISEKETSREISFCGHAILEDELFEIHDALEDERFKDNPLVTEYPKIRFYAGMPLKTKDGSNLGTLCVIDKIPRTLEPHQRKSLHRIGKQVIALLEHRKALLEVANLSNKLDESYTFNNALLNSTDESIISTTPDGLITSFNQGASEMLGYSAEDIVAKVTPAILHDPNEVKAYAQELSLEFGRPIQPGFEVFVLKAIESGSDSRRWTYIRKDGSRLIVNLSVTALKNHQGALIGFLGVARDETSTIESENSLAELTSILERTGEMAKIGGWELNLLNNEIKWTKEVFNIHEVEPPNPPPLKDALEFYPLDARTKIQAVVQKCIESGSPWDMELPFITAKGRHIWVRTQGSAIMSNGRAISLLGSFQDITERKKSELDLAWLNRALHMLSKSNQALAQINDEKKLIVEICRIAVQIGGYRMAWVGYAENDAYKTVSPQAFFGESGKTYIEAINLSWSENIAIGNGPAGKAIRSGKPHIVEDILLDSSFPVQGLATQHGYKSLAALPLKTGRKTIGMLALYSPVVRSFAEQEITLLQELADNLSVGISNLNAQKNAHRLNQAIVNVASSITANTGQEFFKKIASSMTETLQADAGCIAQLLPEKPRRASMLAVSVDGKFEENFQYGISDAMAKSLFGSNDLIIVKNNAHKEFPQLSMMKFYPFQAFAGLHLNDSKGNDVGLVFVFFKEAIPQQSNDIIHSILKIFAARIANELERMSRDLVILEQASMLEKTRDAIVVQDMNQKVTFWNKGAEALYGWTSDEVLDQPIQNILHQDSEVFNHALVDLLDHGEWTGEITEHHKNGSKLIIEEHWTLLRNIEGKPKSIFAIKSDVTQRKIAEEQTRQFAFYDSLTLLPNRRLLLDRLEKALSLALRKKQFGAIMFIDLDNFKKLNDTLGHDKGDLLLKEVASRILKCVRDCDTVARLGGDEFVVMIEDLTFEFEQAKSQAEQIGEKILEALNYTFDFDGYLHSSTPSIGIALFNHETKTTDELIKCADKAMYKSKTTGRNKITFYETDMST